MRIDYIGLGLLSVGLGFLQVVLDKGQRDDWFGSHFIVWCSVACAVGLVGAVIWELRQKDPVVELHLFKNRNYATATFLMFLLGIVLYGSTVLVASDVADARGLHGATERAGAFARGDCDAGVSAAGGLVDGAISREVAGDFWLTESCR